jgi:hypothetical protein
MENAAVVRISAKKQYEPCPGIISILFFPTKPIPPDTAKLLSRTGTGSSWLIRICFFGEGD